MVFNRITESDTDIIKKYTLLANTRNCEFALVNVFGWNDTDELMYGFAEGLLVYRLINSDYAIYSVVSEDFDSDRIFEILEEDARENGKQLMITNLSETVAKRYMEDLQYSVTFEREWSDYIYRVDRMISLSGSKLHSKKNMLNRFIKSYNYEYEKITNSNIDECKAMKNEWMASRKCDESLNQESEIIDYILDNMERFDITGGLLRVDGKVAAITLGEKMSEDTFVTHVEKGLDGYCGIYQAINQIFTTNELGKYTYVNREDDMGNEGIRKAKLSYRPDIMYHKYCIEKKQFL